MKKWLNWGFSLSLIISLCAFSYWHVAKSENKQEFSFADVIEKAKQLGSSSKYGAESKNYKKVS